VFSQWVRPDFSLARGRWPNRIFMEAFAINHSLSALFLLSFLASTLIPLGSEWLLVVLGKLGRYAAVAAITTASLG
jgi:membrane protein YqaA with SNARE-associated domain